MRNVVAGILFVLFPSLLMAQSRQTYLPGDSIPSKQLSKELVKNLFFSEPIPSDIFALMRGKSYKDNCTIPQENLCYLHLLHQNKEGQTLVGELVCNKRIAETLLTIFKKLYDASYPIERMRLVDYYQADDETSMRANNSSCFNYRTISRTQHLSKHSQGLAIDINPLYNPYVRSGKVEPATAHKYVNRNASFPYKIKKGDYCYQLFIKYGFKWGGDWRSRKDYQHFEIDLL